MGRLAQLIINKDDIPSKQNLEQSISRLRHCADLLKNVKGKKYEDPEALRQTANFIEMLIKNM